MKTPKCSLSKASPGWHQWDSSTCQQLSDPQLKRERKKHINLVRVKGYFHKSNHSISPTKSPIFVFYFSPISFLIYSLPFPPCLSSQPNYGLRKGNVILKNRRGGGGNLPSKVLMEYPEYISKYQIVLTASSPDITRSFSVPAATTPPSAAAELLSPFLLFFFVLNL